MNRQLLQQSALAWMQQAKADVAGKLSEFLQETGLSVTQAGNDMGIDPNELNNILNGGVPTMETFVKLLIASGNVLQITPIEDSPLPVENGMPVPPVGGFERQGAPGVRRPFPPMGNRRMPPPPAGLFDNFQRQPAPEPAPVQQQPRGANGQFKPWPKQAPAPGMGRPAAPVFGGQQTNQHPPFATMSREQLVDIVRQHLWQSEIDLANVDHAQLVRFLEAKDRQFEELRAEQNGNAIDPSVVQLKEKLKKTIEKNPNLRGFLKDLFD